MVKEVEKSVHFYYLNAAFKNLFFLYMNNLFFRVLVDPWLLLKKYHLYVIGDNEELCL